MTNLKYRYQGPALLVVVTLCTYLNSLFNGFVWDDNLFLLKDRAIADFRISELLFSTANGMEYIPIHSLTLAIEHLLWGFNPGGFHLVNLMVYLTGVLTLYSIVADMPVAGIDMRKTALWTSLVFALHPMHSEPVNFISNRCHLLAFMFVMLSSYWLVKWLNNPTARNMSLSLLFFVLSLLSKQSTVAFPVLVLAALFLNRNRTVSMRQKTVAAAGFMLADAAAVFIHLRNAFHSTTAIQENLPTYSVTIAGKIIKTINIYSFYIHKYIFPKGLALYYNDNYLYSGISISSVLSLLLMLAVFAAAFYSFRGDNVAAIGLLWYSVMSVPSLNLIKTSPVIANRYGLIPTVGLSLVIGYAICRLNDRYAVSKYISVAFLTVLAAVTVSKNFDWKSDYTLFKAAMELNPYANRINYADALWREKKYVEALATLKEEMNLTGSYNYYYFLGKYHDENGNQRDAIEAYKSALLQNGDASKPPHLALANAYYKAGDHLNAIKEFLCVIDLSDADPFGLINAEAKEKLSLLQGRFLPEIEGMKSRMVPGGDNRRLLSEIALFYQNIGLYREAADYYDGYIKLEPGNWAVWHNRALCFSRRHDFDEAIASFDKSFLYNGANIEALNQIGSLYVKLRNPAKAEEYFKKAIAIDQANVSSRFNLAILYIGTGRKSEAAKQFEMAISSSGNSEFVRNRAKPYLREQWQR